MSVLNMNQKLTVSFSYPTCLGSCHYKKFHNHLNNNEEFTNKMIHIIGKMIPEISNKTLPELRTNRNYHTHPLENDKRNLVLDVLKELLKNRYGLSSYEAEKMITNQCLEMNQFWQISCPDSKGIRLIGFMQESVFIVLFIDYYHTIFNDQKYNEENIESYNFNAFDYLERNR